MNYYERHLGDYARDTAHLSMLEHGAYALLLDRYYATERGIPDDERFRVARARTISEKVAVDDVLAEFFELKDGLWVHKRVEFEIEKARKRIEAARANGANGGRPRKPDKNPVGSEPKPSGFLLGSVLETQSKALHTPYTKHQEEIPMATASQLLGDPAQKPPVPPPAVRSKPAKPEAPSAFSGEADIERMNGRCIAVLSAEFALPQDWGEDAERLGWPGAVILREAERFRQYWAVGKGVGKRKSVRGWRQAWSNWLAKAERMQR